MNIRAYIANLAALLILFTFLPLAVLYAQNSLTDQLVVPLSNPSSPGTLEVNHHNGSITVKGYSGNEIIVNVKPRESKVDTEPKTRNGLTRIPNNSMELSIEENENYVQVHSQSWNRTLDYEIKVPSKFSLNLKTHNHGDIFVESVEGEIELTNHNGEITLREVAGYANVTTFNGDIKASFTKVQANKPMAFSTYNGDVDLTFPPSLKATTKMKSQRGDILTDFEMEIKKISPKVENKQLEKNYTYKLSLENWVVGDINGGGPEFMIKNYNGDILIRKKN